MQSSEEFNLKYKDYLKEGYYGLALDNQQALDYLDNKFQEYIKIPEFKCSQIKSKFNWFCFYADNLPDCEDLIVQAKLKEIYGK